MRTTLLLVVGLCACQAPEAAGGYLIIAGGGRVSEAVVARALTLAGGVAARVLVVPQASRLPNAGQSSVELFVAAGATEVSLLDLTEPEAALAAVRRADLIWIGGGDQNRLMGALADTGIAEAVRVRYRAGAVIGGKSAGAAVMSRLMITGEADLEAIAAEATRLAPGFALWPEVIVDQHFVGRRRFNRLLSAVLDHPQLLGVGIDERTVVIVSDGGRRLDVAGRGTVTLLDARRARVPATTPGAPSAARNVRLHLLRDGDTYTIVPVGAGRRTRSRRRAAGGESNGVSRIAR